MKKLFKYAFNVGKFSIYMKNDVSHNFYSSISACITVIGNTIAHIRDPKSLMIIITMLYLIFHSQRANFGVNCEMF